MKDLSRKIIAKLADAQYVRWPVTIASGPPVEIFRLTERKEREIAAEKVSKALNGIRKYAPVRYAALEQDVSRIRLVSTCDFTGPFLHETQTIELNLEVLILPQTKISTTAALLIHEAQHARLQRLGFGYSVTERWRVERLCFRAQRNFGRRIRSARVIADAEEWLNSDGERYFQRSFRREAALNTFAEVVLNLRRQGYPYWSLAPFVWLIKRLTSACMFLVSAVVNL